MKRLLILALLGMSLCGGARAEDNVVLTGTLAAINQRGSILIGYRDSAPPFSFLNPGHQPIGFALDLCHGIAEDVAQSLNRDLVEADAPAWQTGVRIVYVPVTGDERISKIVAGAIDLECGSTTANAERTKSIAFSPVFFLAGTRLLVPLVNGRPAVSGYRGLAGRTIVTASGTTTATVIHRLAATVSPPINVSEVPSLDAAYDMLASHKADAFASDDILLSGFVSTRPEGNRFGITGDYLSFEPYAIGFRRDDTPFADLVRDSFARMATEGTLNRLYTRWLMDRLPNGKTLGVPISPQLAEMYRALGQPD
jgi:glutamate/aspartate transport system substrate-binding protein